MAELVLGPIVRYVGEREATVWVQTDVACEVTVLGRRTPTFHVAGHHYALVALEGLEPGGDHEYAVELDGQRRWPADGDARPPGRIRTLDPRRPLRIAFGSCRLAVPDEPPWDLAPGVDPRGYGPDALHALARRLQAQPAERWPALLLMIGDQVYADSPAPETRAFIRGRRSLGPAPGEQVSEFAEYAHLYRASWSVPEMRWLLSTVPSAMIFDDHEVVDDWNISAAWKEEMRRRPWWTERIVGAFTSYWLYQHLGNLSPRELRADDLYRRARAADDAGPLLRELALQADQTTDGTRWSWSRELGCARLVVVDSRAGRVLGPDRRDMLDAAEWEWVSDRLRGDVDHLLVATSVPFLQPRAIHALEGVDAALCAGAWGPRVARLAERLRRAIDLEHWAAFRTSFRRLAATLREVATGRRGRAPAAIVVLSGDVHHGYVAEAGFPGARAGSRVSQVVCSPFRQAMSPTMQRANRLAFTRALQGAGELIERLVLPVARRAPAGTEPISWRIRHGPYFANQLATIELVGGAARVRIERAVAAPGALETMLEAELTNGPPGADR